MAHAYMNQARLSFQIWKKTTVRERLTYLNRMKARLKNNLDEWVTLLSEEGEKTPTDALTSDLMTTLGALSFLIKNSEKLLKTRKEKTPIYAFFESARVEHLPYGVTLIFAPWNFPIQLALIPALTALAAGNSVIVKPSEYTSEKIILHIARLIHEAGLPEHVFQIAKGGPSMGQALIEQGPDKIFFTGGTRAGRLVYQKAAERLIPCELELGGKDALIVLKDAPIERAAKAAVWGSFFHGGQVCIGIERVFVHEDVLEPFLKEVKKETEALILGRDLPERLNEAVFARLKEQLEEALCSGAQLFYGEVTENRAYLVILTGVQANMRVMTEETFGPVMPILSFRNADEMVELVNQNPYGLNAAIFTKDLTHAAQLSRRLEVGNCYINNVVTNVSNMNLPFSGRKKSGFGVSRGKEGLYAFTRPFSLSVNKGKRRREMNWFPYSEKNVQLIKRLIRLFF